MGQSELHVEIIFILQYTVCSLWYAIHIIIYLKFSVLAINCLNCGVNITKEKEVNLDKKDFDAADYNYALDSYSKMLGAIAEAGLRVETYLKKKQVLKVKLNVR